MGIMGISHIVMGKEYVMHAAMGQDHFSSHHCADSLLARSKGVYFTQLENIVFIGQGADKSSWLKCWIRT